MFLHDKNWGNDPGFFRSKKTKIWSNLYPIVVSNEGADGSLVMNVRYLQIVLKLFFFIFRNINCHLFGRFDFSVGSGVATVCSYEGVMDELNRYISDEAGAIGVIDISLNFNLISL